MTVRSLYLPIQPMDYEFSLLVLAYLPTNFFCLSLSVRMSANSLGTASLDIPTAIRIVH